MSAKASLIKEAGQKAFVNHGFILIELFVIAMLTLAFSWTLEAIGMGRFSRYVNIVGVLIGISIIVDTVVNLFMKVASTFGIM